MRQTSRRYSNSSHSLSKKVTPVRAMALIRISYGCLPHNQWQPYWTFVKQICGVKKMFCMKLRCDITIRLVKINFQSCISYSVTPCILVREWQKQRTSDTGIAGNMEEFRTRHAPNRSVQHKTYSIMVGGNSSQLLYPRKYIKLVSVTRSLSKQNKSVAYYSNLVVFPFIFSLVSFLLSRTSLSIRMNPLDRCHVSPIFSPTPSTPYSLPQSTL
jgi:hypothetical protein